MDLLKKRIMIDSIVEDNIVKVDMFLNHQLDIELIEELGEEIADRFVGSGITKVLTAESSGIPLACFAARSLGVQALYAKKFHTGYIDPSVYESEVHSFTLDKAYTLRISKKYLSEGDIVLIVDDFLANGHTILGLLEISSKAGAEVSGVAVAIEKANRDGGRVLRQMGIRLEPLVVIERIENGRPVLL